MKHSEPAETPLSVAKTSQLRVRWAAIGAAIAVSLGGGTLAVVSATSSSTQSAFVPVTPIRILDTRSGTKIGSLDGLLPARTVPVTGSITTTVGVRTVVPSGATGVSLNVTAVSTLAPDSGGFVTVYPCDVDRPDASNLNFVSGQTVPNAVTSSLSAAGTVCVYVYGQAHILIDVVGYYELSTGSSVAGPTGPIGATGPAGVQGVQGPIGTPGTNGTNGDPGVDGSSSCMKGFTCVVGDTGPGAGIVFYVGTFTAAGTTCNTACRYLEVAAASEQDVDPVRPWGCQGTSISTDTAIGAGFANTAAIVAACSESDIAARLANDLTVGGKTDWFLPSKDELNALCAAFTDTVETPGTQCNGAAATGHAGVGGFVPYDYWSSSAFDSLYAWPQGFQDATQFPYNKSAENYVRPVRAF